MGTVLSSGKATLHELQTIYGVKDLHGMLEIIVIDANNARVMQEHQARQQGK
ncbi:hypothetical protein ABC766_32155 (plasmid) [Methylobacterium fujisawaense]|jgi:hypothetical protein|uniref:hypothetical protein n=1 Tax=Methylobacterium fujisawaense TaxID=107400 RepID=UPI0031F54636